MVQILTVEYTKEEEKILAISGLLGTFSSLLIGVLLSYWTGLFTNLNLTATDLIGWTVFLLKIGSIMVTICLTTTFAACILLCQKGNYTLSLQEVGKRMIPGISLFPLSMIYAFLVMGLVFVPLNAFLLQYLSPFLIMSVGALVFFPFMIAFAAILLPDTPAGKALRRFLHSSTRGRSKKKERES
jgi:hypothetical protein